MPGTEELYTPRFVIVGREHIAAAIGESPKKIPYLVREQGLPARKESDTAPWKATPEALREWCNEYYSGRTQRASQ